MRFSSAWRAWTFAMAILVGSSHQQASEDPVQDFCRRWQHQTCIVDNKLYIDGGVVAYGGSFDNQSSQRNTWLIYEDLSLSESDNGFPVQYTNLTKPSDVPTVSGGILWPDNINKLFYLYGGEYRDSAPDSFTLWFFDTLTNTWNRSYADGSQAQISRASFGAGTVVEDRGLAYYYGGYLSERSVPEWQGGDVLLNSLVKYDMVANRWTNATYDQTPRAEGTLQYIPASDRGMLVYFGGVQQGSGGLEFVSMDTIFLFDIAAEKWYSQTAGGNIPQARRGFCAGVTWAEDQSSYNIYIYGGIAQDGGALGDIYILSLPSFEWILWYPNVTTTTFQHGKAWPSCNVYEMSQMPIIGGYYSNDTYSDCDAASIGGQHGLSLGQQNIDDAQWYQFLPNLTTYAVPPNVTAAVGGGPTGGATMTEPAAGWATSDLAVYFTRTYSPQTRTPTRYIPSSTAMPSTSASSQPDSTNVGAIAGGTVGGVVAFVIVIGIIVWCLRRRRSHKAAQTQNPPSNQQPQTPLAEKDGTSIAFSQSPHTGYSSTPRSDTASSSTWKQNQYSPQQPPPRTNWTPVPVYPGAYGQQPQQTYYPPPPRPQQYPQPGEETEGRAELSSVRSPVNLDDTLSRSWF